MDTASGCIWFPPMSTFEEDLKCVCEAKSVAKSSDIQQLDTFVKKKGEWYGLN